MSFRDISAILSNVSLSVEREGDQVTLREIAGTFSQNACLAQAFVAARQLADRFDGFPFALRLRDKPLHTVGALFEIGETTSFAKLLSSTGFGQIMKKEGTSIFAVPAFCRFNIFPEKTLSPTELAARLFLYAKNASEQPFAIKINQNNVTLNPRDDFDRFYDKLREACPAIFTPPQAAELPLTPSEALNRLVQQKRGPARLSLQQ